MALVIRCPTAMTSPAAGTPTVPDIVSNLLMKLSANDLSLSNGANVTLWTSSTGSGDTNIKTYDRKNSAAAWPTFHNTNGPNGGKCVQFDGTMHLRSPGSFTTVSQPLTYGVVFRVGAFSGINTSTNRIIGGESGALQNFRPSTSNNLFLDAGAGKQVVAGLSTSVWYVAVYTLNGASSAAIVADTVWAGDAGSNGASRLFIGSSSTTTAGTGFFIGDIAHIQVHNRAFTEVEREILYDQLKIEYGL